MAEITVNNVNKIGTETLRDAMFKLISVHVDYITMDQDKFVYLLGYYPAIYNYMSELFTFQIARVRERTEFGDKFGAAQARDKRDILEQALKSCKMQYDSLSRKITIFTAEERR